MPRPDAPAAQPRFGTAVITALVIAALFFARDFLIPLALAILLSFMLSPLLTRLQRLGLNRIASVVLVVTFCLSLVLGIGYVVAVQMIDLAENLPHYQENIRGKAQRFRASAGGFGKFRDDLSEIGKQFVAPTTAPATQQAIGGVVHNLSGEPTAKPIQVEVKEREPAPIDVLKSNITPYFAPLGVAGMVIVFVVFFLLQLEDLRDRVIRLISGGELTTTTQALDDA